MKNNQMDFLIESITQLERIRLILTTEVDGDFDLIGLAIEACDEARFQIEDLLARKLREKE